jgi:hypothetical protein
MAKQLIGLTTEYEESSEDDEGSAEDEDESEKTEDEESVRGCRWSKLHERVRG